MAYIQGYQCDRCERIFKKGETTRVTTTYEGPVVTGRRVEDLCKECLGETPPQDSLRPLLKRKGKKRQPSVTE